MNSDMTALISHLMRRAGFGVKKSDLGNLMESSYEEIVDNLIEPKMSDSVDDALVRRYHPDQSTSHDMSGAGSYWLYRMVSSRNPLREKIVLFWHNIFATGYAKVTNGKPFTDQARMFRNYGLGRLDELLLRLSKDPAMIIWLDNIDNHSNEINENYGRELLELFSMGVGNYSEDDIKECARSFTGWTLANSDYIKQLAQRNSIMPYGKLAWRYEYDANDHDSTEKTFLGEKGNFNGEDIIKIICEQPATARFISRHLYHFFVADEPPVTQWPYTNPQDQEAIKELEKVYFQSDHNIGSMVKYLLNAEFFKSEQCYNMKLKSPAELVTGILKITEEFTAPGIEISARNSQMGFMGQTLFNPPSVEGWHQGTEWIETGSLTERINFASGQIGDVEKPGIKKLVRDVIDDLNDQSLTSESFVNSCLDHLGGLQVSPTIKSSLIEFADDTGVASSEDGGIEQKVTSLLALVAATPEFQRT
ncbi:MAG: hypothetical protein CL742_02060 [Chloroflexi bacterium]|nr:hypothetical protein [Chloroflexota bacterium]